MGIDLLSVSGHKIHGPKGVGFLYINEKAKIQPQILGGGQQGGMRSGTDNVPGIAGLGTAAVEIYKNLEENVENMYRLKEHIAQGLEKIGDSPYERNGAERRRASDFKHQRYGSAKRSTSSLSGGKRHLCFCRKRLLQATNASPAPRWQQWVCQKTRSKALCA